MNQWSIEDARRCYNLPFWADGYFDINEQGEVVAKAQNGPAITLSEIIEQAQSLGVGLPLLLRFEDILSHRIDQLSDAFTAAMQVLDYSGGYTPVYPIKVNQQGCVVQTIANDPRTGLEAGSKPELLAVLGSARPGSTIICNGYKDRQYIRLALIGQLLGHKVYPVVEQPGELALILQEADNLGIQPTLGVRVRLATIGKGNWQNTGGEKSKFGLTVQQLIELVETLREKDKLDWLQLLHCHLGSQLANLRDIRRGLREAAQTLVQLHKLGASIHTVDVGGGLGVDYEGTRSRSSCSMNYGISDYAQVVVQSFAEICSEHELIAPHIITEAGRAMTAHHAVLVTNVVDVEPGNTAHKLQEPAADAAWVLTDLWQCLHNTQQSAAERFHEAQYCVQEAHELFAHGHLDIEGRAAAEALYNAICQQLPGELNPQSSSEREVLQQLNDKLADKLFINLSVFQSLPDIWAIQQRFPILPLSGLDKEPSKQAVLHDLTCDSDGRIDQFVANGGIQSTLPVHELEEGRPYNLGIFMVGAYQEIIGDIHNLFGDTHAINVKFTDSGFELTDTEWGDTADELLSYVHLPPAQLRQSYQRKILAAKLSNGSEVYNELAQALTAATYLT